MGGFDTALHAMDEIAPADVTLLDDEIRGHDQGGMGPLDRRQWRIVPTGVGRPLADAGRQPET